MIITQKIRVEDMHCPNCEMRLEALEEDLPGVVEVNASYPRQEIAIRFDETIINIEEILSAIRELGYTPLLVR